MFDVAAERVNGTSTVLAHSQTISFLRIRVMDEERLFDIGLLMKLNFEEWSNVEKDLAAKKIWVGKELSLRPLEKSDYLKGECAVTYVAELVCVVLHRKNIDFSGLLPVQDI